MVNLAVISTSYGGATKFICNRLSIWSRRMDFSDLLPVIAMNVVLVVVSPSGALRSFSLIDGSILLHISALGWNLRTGHSIPLDMLSKSVVMHHTIIRQHLDGVTIAVTDTFNLDIKKPPLIPNFDDASIQAWRANALLVKNDDITAVVDLSY